MAGKEKKMGVINTILILHGWAYETEKWDDLAGQLNKNGYEVNILKIPGLTQKIDRAWTIKDYVEWLDVEIKKAGGNIALIGHSNGGRIALSYLRKYPDVVSKLILVDSAGICHNELPIRLKRFIFGTLAKIGKKITASDDIRRVFYKFTREKDYLNTTGETRETMRNLIKVDVTNSLSLIKIPTLIIWGEEDQTTPLIDGKLMNKLIPNSRLEIIKGARHAPQFTHPNKVCHLITEFV